MENNDQDTLQALDESNSKWVEGWRKAAKKITFDDSTHENSNKSPFIDSWSLARQKIQPLNSLNITIMKNLLQILG